MMVGIAIAALIGWALLWARASGVQIEAAVLPAASSIILILIAAGVAGDIFTATIILTCVGLVALAACYRAIPKLLTPGMVLFGAGALLVSWIFRDATFLAWDDFSHWGLVSKFILTTDAMPSRPGDVRFLDYPRGLAAFHYFMACFGVYSEGKVIAAQGVFQLASLLPLFAGLRWRQADLYLPLATICALGSYLFQVITDQLGHWDALYADLPLAFATAAAGIIYFRNVKPAAVWAIVPIIALLPHIKETGIFFAIGILAIITVDQIAFEAHRRWLPIGGCVLSLVASVTLWKAYLFKINAPPTINTSLAFLVERTRAPDFYEKANTVTARWLDAMAGGVPIDVAGGTFPTWLLILLALLIASAFIQQTRLDALRAIVTQAGMICIGASYAAVLLALYVLVVADYEALQLHSFTRYMLTPIVAAALIGLSFILSGRRILSSLIIVFAAGATILICTVNNVSGRIAERTAGIRAIRAAAEAAVGDAKSIPEHSSVYVLWNGTTGLPYYISQFLLLPRPTNVWCFSIGAKRIPGDVWSCNYDASEISNLVAEFDYLLLGRTDDIFWNQFGALFAEGSKNHAWFKIEHGSYPPFRPLPSMVSATSTAMAIATSRGATRGTRAH